MLPATHPLAALQAQAALASRWPTLHLFLPTEAALEAARSALEERLGPLPQACVIEPWEAVDEDWELRVDLPELGAADWLLVRERFPAAILVPGLRPAARHAADVGLLDHEVLEAGGLVARMAYDAEHGGLLGLDVARFRPDATTTELEVELVRAVARCGAGIHFRSSRGPDTVQPFVHRSTGRFGMELHFPPELFDGLDSAAARVRREAILGAVAEVVHGRSEHPTLRLAPDVCWDERLGTNLLVFAIGPALPTLPADRPVAGVELAELGGLEGLADAIEVQVVPVAAARHTPVVRDVMEAAERAGWPLHGAAPRWVRSATGWSYAPTWSVPLDRAGAIDGIAQEIRMLPGVAAVRAVPSWPSGLGEGFATCEPAWHVGRRVCFLRLRDALGDRDRLEQVRPRDPDDRDRATSEAVLGALGELRAAIEEGRPLSDASGRAGTELRLDAHAARDEDRLRLFLDALGDLCLPHLASLALLGFRGSDMRIRLWYRHERPEPHPPRAWLGS